MSTLQDVPDYFQGWDATPAAKESIMPVPDVPTDGDWTGWIITVLLTVLSTMVGTVVFLAKMIEGKYRAEIADLKNEITLIKQQTRAAYDSLLAETIECRKSREELAVKNAALETRVSLLERYDNER